MRFGLVAVPRVVFLLLFGCRSFVARHLLSPKNLMSDSQLHSSVSALKERNHYLIRLIDDEPEVLSALAILLECAGWRSKTYTSAEAFLKDVDAEPGCVVLDLLMPSMNGLELQDEMRRRNIRLPIVFVTGHATVDTAVSAMRHGAVHFLQKPVDRDKLFQAITEACSEFERITMPSALDDEEILRRLQTLTDRQRAVLDYVLQGMQSREIGERLGISHRTVLGHRAALNRIFEIHSQENLERLSKFAASALSPSFCGGE